MTESAFLVDARAVIACEGEALSPLGARLDLRFVEACEALMACTGRVIVTGMGKSGHIGSKIAATLASTGTPAFFEHPDLHVLEILNQFLNVDDGDGINAGKRFIQQHKGGLQ